MGIKMKNETKYFFTTDTHFFHDKLLSVPPDPRKKGYEEVIIERHRYVLNDNSVLVHLGDVILHQYDELKPILNYWAGKKILVRGNHDKKSKTWYLKNGFDFVCDAFVYNRILFTHIPQPVGMLDYFDYNVHGHFHNAPERYLEFTTIEKHRLLALEYTDYYPVEFSKLIKKTKPGSNIVDSKTISPALIGRDEIQTFRDSKNNK
jgi:calcineurin-like phosphoesterase family protein